MVQTDFITTRGAVRGGAVLATVAAGVSSGFTTHSSIVGIATSASVFGLVIVFTNVAAIVTNPIESIADRHASHIAKTMQRVRPSP